MDQQKSVDELEEIYISRDRSRQSTAETTDYEKKELRATLGSLSWMCGQTNFLYAVDVNFLITEVPVSTVGELIKANQLVRNLKKWHGLKFKIHAFPESEDLELTCWSDAAWANRPNERDSTERVFIGMSTRALRMGKEADVSPIYWKSGKIDRVCRSPAAAETIAALDGEDDLLFMRLMWGELCGHPLDLTDQNACPRMVRGHLVTDAKNLFDKLHAPILVGVRSVQVSRLLGFGRTWNGLKHPSHGFTGRDDSELPHQDDRRSTRCSSTSRWASVGRSFSTSG